MKFKAGNTQGGARKNAGRKSDGFRKKCATLADSPKFFEWARQVFDGEAVDCRLDKNGQKVYLEVSTGDRVYLWEKLAAYGFGRPSDFDPSQLVVPLQKTINDLQALKLELYALNYPERSSGSKVVGVGTSAVQT